MRTFTGNASNETKASTFEEQNMEARTFGEAWENLRL